MKSYYKIIRHRRPNKVSVWVDLASGASTILDVFGASAKVDLVEHDPFEEDSERLRGDARAIGEDFATVLRSAAG
jgi:hypothetical protein